MFQENISKKQKKKKILFFFSKIFPEIFQVWRARSHTFGAEAMAQGPPNQNCFKKIFKET
jgi:hypothetical protein